MAYDPEIFKEALEFTKALVASGQIEFRSVPHNVDEAYKALSKVYDKYAPRRDGSAYDGASVVANPDGPCPF